MITLELTAAEWGLVHAGLRMLRAKDNKSQRALVRKFGDEAVLRSQRRESLDSALKKVDSVRKRIEQEADDEPQAP